MRKMGRARARSLALHKHSRRQALNQHTHNVLCAYMTRRFFLPAKQNPALPQNVNNNTQALLANPGKHHYEAKPPMQRSKGVGCLQVLSMGPTINQCCPWDPPSGLTTIGTHFWDPPLEPTIDHKCCPWDPPLISVLLADTILYVQTLC